MHSLSVPITDFKPEKTHQLLKTYQRLTLKSIFTVYIHQAEGHILNSKKWNH